mgnify:CR=1 FL=1
MDGKTCYTDKKEAVAMTTLSIQVDEKVEKEAEKLFADFGLDISASVDSGKLHSLQHPEGISECRYACSNEGIRGYDSAPGKI